MTIVLVHGAWHGSWCWDRVLPLIEQRGFAVRTIDLPSIGADPASGASLSDDAAALKALMDSLSGPILLCGHSYGGMVISLAADSRVTRLVYLCAFAPDDGQSLVDVCGGKPEPWIQADEQGNTLPDMTRTKEIFFADCDRATQEWAESRIKSMPLAPFVEPVPAPAWRKIPSTYVVCTLDQAIPVDLQRKVLAPRATEVVELQSSHSPFLSQPAAVAELLVERATRP